LSSDDGSVPRIQELALPEKSLRAMIIQQAERHINERYLWGGRSLFDAEEKSVLTFDEKLNYFKSLRNHLT
jgi:hypothetical protein